MPSSTTPSEPDLPVGTARWVARGDARIRAWDHPGEGPAIVLLHGFPDDHHLYDLLLPYLAGRRVVTFDFLGWGESDKPPGHAYTFAGQVDDLDAVIAGLGLDRVVLVPHDASGPAAVNWALDHPDRVAAIVALNTFYGPAGPAGDVVPTPPEAIRLFSDPDFARLTGHFAASPAAFRWLYDFQVGGFIQDPEVRAAFVPLLFRQFDARPSTVGPFLRLNADLRTSVLGNAGRAGELAAFPAPVRTAFGEADPYLSPDYGAALAAQFPAGEAVTIPGAGHFPQLDAPGAVAEQLLTVPLARPGRVAS